jgi:hypothetical protein
MIRDNFWLVVMVALIIGAFGGWLFGSSQPSYTLGQQKTQIASSKSESLKMDMRKLWEDHITWTRLYIISATSNLEDSDENLARLMKNQEDIGGAIKPYYGDEAGNKLTQLLKEHISLAGEVVKAAVDKNPTALADADKRWHDNGDQLADFLASANPNWPKDETRQMMKDHLDLTRQEAVDILAGRAEASIADYDKIHNQILKMADMLSAGIIKQFPDKF